MLSYASCALTHTQWKYCMTRKELLPVVKFTRQYKHYLLGRKFVVRSDRNSLAWLMHFKNIEGQLARWLEELSQFDMEVLHRPEKLHSNAAGLSRIPDELGRCDCYMAGTEPDSLPCKGCPYCKRAHRQWFCFETEVNDVVTVTRKDGDADGNSDLDLADKDEAESVDSLIPEFSSGDINHHEAIGKLQELDPDLKLLFVWLWDNQRISEKDLVLSGPATKYFRLSLSRGVLYYKRESEVGLKKTAGDP